MPIQQNNVVMRNTQGMFGGQVVFRLREGKMIVAAPPTVNPHRKLTDPQSDARKTFLRCVRYARSAMGDAALRADYAAKVGTWQTPYNLAFRDAYRSPEIHGVIVQGYRGQAGDIIVVSASDDFKVAAVMVSVYSAGGELIETGNAAPDDTGLNWVYTATQPNAAVPGSLIRVAAFDMPGNETTVDIAAG